MVGSTPTRDTIQRMKRCYTCGQDKPLSDFARKGKGHNSQCKSCKNEYNRRHYKANEAKYKAKAGNHQVRLCEIQRQYMESHPCVDCGESDPDVLDLDHVRGTKVNSVSRLVRLGVSVQTLLDEIAKCEVRCANCHRRITRQRERMRS